MSTLIHVGKVRRIPFIVRASGVIDTATPVAVGVSQPDNLAVELDGPRTLKLRATAPSILVSAVVKVFPGTAFEQHFSYDVATVAATPPPVDVEFGEPSDETDG